MFEKMFSNDETDLVITFQLIASDDTQEAPEGPGWYLVATRNKGRNVVERRRVSRDLVNTVATTTDVATAADAAVPATSLREAVNSAELAFARRLTANDASEQARLAALRAERVAAASKEFYVPEPEVTAPVEQPTDEIPEAIKDALTKARSGAGNAAGRAAEAAARTDLPDGVKNALGRFSRRINGQG